MTIDKIVEHLKQKYPEQMGEWTAEYNLKCAALHSQHEAYLQGLNDYLKERAGDHFTQTGSYKLPNKADLAKRLDDDDETKQIKRLV